MEIITILIPIAILLALFFVVAFIWMTISGQYDDLETPALRMLLDEKKLSEKNNQTKNSIEKENKKENKTNKEKK